MSKRLAENEIKIEYLVLISYNFLNIQIKIHFKSAPKQKDIAIHYISFLSKLLYPIFHWKSKFFEILKLLQQTTDKFLLRIPLSYGGNSGNMWNHLVEINYYNPKLRYHLYEA